MLTCYKSIIRPHLEYCSEIWNPYKLQDIIQIEQIQRSFTSKIFGTQNLNYWERLRNLNLLSLQRRRERQILIYVWKIKNNIYPNNINMEFFHKARTNAIQAKIKPLPRVNAKLVTIYDESFLIKSSKLWNKIPPNLTRITSLRQFKSSLNKFISTLPDQPPIPGYPCRNQNSILDI